MKTIDMSIKNIELLKNMIGKTFVKYKCDPFIFAPSVYGIAGLYVDSEVFRLSSLLQPVERFYSNEEVAVFSITPAEDAEIVTMMDEGEMTDTIVKDTIRSIQVVNDIETVCHGDEKRCFVSTKGIVFYLDSGNEISFEIKTWFSEMITIKRGYNLIDQFESKEDFFEEWECCDGYTPEWKREILTFR